MPPLSVTGNDLLIAITIALFNCYLIISPITGVLQEGSTDKEEILLQEIDLSEVKRIREFDSWWQPKEQII